MERIAGLLIPPACRETVLGDLHERYTTRARYAADAMSSVPHVIASRIRRTTDPVTALMEVMLLYAAFLAFNAWFGDSSRFWGPLISSCVAGVAFRLRDAYASSPRRSPLGTVWDSELCVGCGVLFQLLLEAVDPSAAIPTDRVLIPGAHVGLIFISALRIAFPRPGTQMNENMALAITPRQAAAHKSLLDFRAAGFVIAIMSLGVWRFRAALSTVLDYGGWTILALGAAVSVWVVLRRWRNAGGRLKP